LKLTDQARAGVILDHREQRLLAVLGLGDPGAQELVVDLRFLRIAQRDRDAPDKSEQNDAGGEEKSLSGEKQLAGGHGNLLVGLGLRILTYRHCNVNCKSRFSVFVTAKRLRCYRNGAEFFCRRGEIPADAFLLWRGKYRAKVALHLDTTRYEYGQAF